MNKKLETTENYVRARVRSPDDFVSGSLRTITLSVEEAIRAVSGRLKSGDATAIQSYLFDREKWNVGTVKTWLSKHNLTVKSMENDELIISPDRVAFGHDSFEVKETTAGDEKHLYVEGFATTSATDRMGDVITKEFYEDNIKRKTLEQARTLLLNHDKELHIGVVESAVLKEKTAGEWGLWVKAMISNAASCDDYRKQIKEGVLNAFSFRWQPVAEGEQPIVSKDGKVTGMRVKGGTIIEFSVVSLPANPNAEIDKWYEKALPNFGKNITTEWVQADIAAAVAEGIATALEPFKGMAQDAEKKRLAAEAEKRRLEEEAAAAKKKKDGDMEGKGSADTAGHKGTENIMNEKLIKSIIATLTKSQWDGFDAETKKEILAVDGAVESRLELAALKAEKAELEKQLASAVKPEVKLADATKSLTQADIDKIKADAVEEAKKAMGTTAAKGMNADGSRSTSMPDAPAVRVKMFAAPEAEGKELTDEEIAKKLTGQFFMSGKEGRAQITKLVNELGGRA